MATPVTDPAILAQLNAPDASQAAQPAAPAAPRPVTDPNILAQLNSPATPAAPAPQGPISAGRTAQQALGGFNAGVGGILNAPNDLADAGVAALRRMVGMDPSTQSSVHDVYNKEFVEPGGPPQNNLESVVRKGGEMTGANTPLLATGLGAAGAGIRSGVTMAEQAAPGIANKLRGAADAVLEWMAQHPTSAAVSDTAGAFQAGAGGETARGMAESSGAGPTGQKLAETLGQFGAPAAISTYAKVAPTALAVKGAAWGAKKAAQTVPESVTDMLPERFQPSNTTSAERAADQLAYSNREGKYANPDEPAPEAPGWIARQQDIGAQKRTQSAASTVQDEMNQITARPEATENMSIADRLKKNIPGFEPGIAKETGDPALLNLQQRLESNATGSDLRTARDKYDTSAAAIRGKADELAPPVEAPKRAGQVGPNPATENPQDLAAGANTQRVQSVNDRLAQQSEVTRGQIQQQSTALPDAERAQSGARFREINDTAEQASNDRTTALRGAIARPDTPLQVGDQQTTVNAALDRRAAINQQMRQYQSATARTVGDVQQMEALTNERANLDRAIEGVNLPGMQEYRDYYRDQHVPNFQEGAGRDIGRYDRFGYDKNKVPDEKVLAQFGGPNNLSAAQQFTRVHGDNPEAVQLMADHQLGRLKAEALDPNTNMIREGAVNKFLAKNRELLDALPPQVRETVAARNPDALYGRLADLETRQRAVADTKVAGLVGKNPEQQIDAALNDWQVMKGLKRSVAGDPQTEAALTRAVMDRAPDPMDAKAFGSWLDGHDRVLRQVLTPEHLQSLKDVLKASQIQGQLPRPSGTAERPKSTLAKTGAAIGTPIKSLLQRVLAVKQGRVGADYTAFDIGTRMVDSFTERETDAIWKEALFNPEVAKTLANSVKGGGATGLQLSRLHNYLLTVGATDAGEDKK